MTDVLMIHPTKNGHQLVEGDWLADTLREIKGVVSSEWRSFVFLEPLLESDIFATITTDTKETLQMSTH